MVTSPSSFPPSQPATRSHARGCSVGTPGASVGTPGATVGRIPAGPAGEPAWGLRGPSTFVLPDPRRECPSLHLGSRGVCHHRPPLTLQGAPGPAVGPGVQLGPPLGGAQARAEGASECLKPQLPCDTTRRSHVSRVGLARLRPSSGSPPPALIHFCRSEWSVPRSQPALGRSAGCMPRRGRGPGGNRARGHRAAPERTPAEGQRERGLGAP